MGIPTAVASNVRTPGFWMRVNFLAAQLSGASGLERVLISGPKFSTGDISNDDEVRRIFGPDDAVTSHGRGNPVHLTAQQLQGHYGNMEVWVASPAPSAGSAATETYTASGTPTENTLTRVYVAGRPTDVPWNTGETATAYMARVLSYCTGKWPLPCALSAGAGAGELDADASVAGTWGNDITLRWEILSGGAGVTMPTDGPLSGGSGEPDYTNLLAFLAEYDFLHIPCLSNADVILAGTSNLRRFRTHFTTYGEGLDAKLQACHVGFTGSVANAITGAVGQNAVNIFIAALRNAESLPCELAGRDMADLLRGLAIRPNYNRISNVLDGLYGSADPQSDRYTPAELEALLQGGVTPLSYRRSDGEVYLVRPVTTHSQTDSGNPDDRCYNQSDFYGGRAVARGLQIALPAEFPNASIVDDLPPGEGADLPEGVVERREVDDWIDQYIKSTWVRAGVVDLNKYKAQREAGAMVVIIDEDDGSQVDFMVPLPIVKIWAKTSGVLNVS